jgi:hypothetical protein
VELNPPAAAFLHLFEALDIYFPLFALFPVHR